MKRSLAMMETVSGFTRSRRPRLTEPLPLKKKSLPWVSATSTRNYMINDGLVDVLKMYHKDNHGFSGNNQYDTLTQYLMDKGNEFEREVVKYIDENCLKSVYVADIINDRTVQQTIDYIKQGVPLIHSAPVRNKRNGTHGIIDLLVRSDYLCHIINENPLLEEEVCIPAPKLKDDYHYVVIDIKFSTLALRADGRHLLNDAKYKAYKAQLYIYTKAVSLIQGYTSRYAFILGRRWRYKSKGENFSSLSCLDKLGVIDFEGVDSDYVEKTNNAIKWIRDVIRKGGSWEINPPSRDELYPNMCVQSGIWDKIKREIAMDIGEISMLWFCGVKQRDIGFNNGIKSWKDPNCTSESLGVSGKRGNVISEMIDINRQNTDLIRPKRIRGNTHNWRSKCNEIFVDFETIMDVCSPMNEIPEQRKTDMIFMIGVAYTNDKNEVLYKSFIANDMSSEEEFRVMDLFISFMEELDYPKMWFWDAERKFWGMAERRHFDRMYSVLTKEEKDHISDEWGKIQDNWSDLSDVFRTEPIIIKGCFGFGLKHISGQMRNYGMITERIESECDSGTTAMVKALRAYEETSNPAQSAIMKDIETYNRFDCVVLNDILTYLRRNH